MFTLIDLSIGSFAIVKEDESQNQSFPMNIHGFIKVMNIHEKLVAVLLPDKASDELIRSRELDVLKEKALELTEDAVADEFSE